MRGGGGGFDDLKLFKAVELIEWQELPAEKPADEIDAVGDAENDHGIPALGLLRSRKGRERFPVVAAGELNPILSDATSCQTNKMTRWGVQQFKRTKAKRPTHYPTKQQQDQMLHQLSSNCADITSIFSSNCEIFSFSSV